MSKPKYRQGRQIASIGHFEECLKRGDKFFRVRFCASPRTLHYGFIQSWQYGYLKRIIAEGRVYETIPVMNEME